MPRFDCRLVTEDGAVLETVVEADSKFEVSETAESRNEFLLSVKEHKESLDLKDRLNRLRKAKPQELENFTSQLATMLKAGVPLLGCLHALAEQAESDTMRNVTEGIMEKVNGGMALSHALGEYPKVFGELYVNMIQAGETAGVLDQILKRLTSFIRHDIEVSRNIKAAMRYPVIVFTALVFAFVGAIVFIIPKFATLFERQALELPLPTRVMIGASNVLSQYWWMVLLVATTSSIGILYYIKTPAGAYQFDFLKLKAPIFKEITVKAALARFAHMLETLSRGGIQIIRALETVGRTVGNKVIANIINEAKDQVAEGISLSEALSNNEFFPKMTLKMISVGEKSGALDDMLADIAFQYDGIVDAKIKQLSSSIEPIMTIMMGAFLLMMALGIFLPMWDMYSIIE